MKVQSWRAWGKGPTKGGWLGRLHHLWRRLHHWGAARVHHWPRLAKQRPCSSSQHAQQVAMSSMPLAILLASGRNNGFKRLLHTQVGLKQGVAPRNNAEARAMAVACCDPWRQAQRLTCHWRCQEAAGAQRRRAIAATGVLSAIVVVVAAPAGGSVASSRRRSQEQQEAQSRQEIAWSW